MKAKEISPGTVHKIPKGVAEIIISNIKLYEMWEDITPLARNEWIC